MRHLLVFGLIGLFVAGVGERLARRLETKAAASSSQTSPAASNVALREVAPRASTNGAVRGPGKLQIRADRDGHFRVAAMVNGRHMNFMVDTGATVIALTKRDADRLGMTASEARGRTALISTANGSVMASSVRLDSVELGDMAVRSVEAVVMPDGKLGENLLGMSYLSRLKRFEMRPGVLVLEQ